MMSTTSDIFDVLREGIKSGRVLVPDSQEYEESLKRWSETCVKQAVS